MREVEHERQLLTNCLVPQHADDVVRMGFDVAEQRRVRNDFQFHRASYKIGEYSLDVVVSTIPPKLK